MNEIKYLALLRGINVGGKNIIKMNDLKKLFEELNFGDITTYIQSGNVIFKSSEKDKVHLSEKIKKALFEKFKNNIDVVILTFSEIEKIINEKPEKFGQEKEQYKYDVMFLIEPLTANEAVQKIAAREGVDEIFEGEKVIYFRREIENITKSYGSKLASTPIYQYLSIRNWNTTKKLYELMRELK